MDSDAGASVRADDAPHPRPWTRERVDVWRTGIARAGAALLAVGTIVAGAHFIANPVVIDVEVDDVNPDMGTLTPVDLGATGLVLLCVGLAMAMALLLAEGYGRSASGRTPRESGEPSVLEE